MEGSAVVVREELPAVALHGTMGMKISAKHDSNAGIPSRHQRQMRMMQMGTEEELPGHVQISTRVKFCLFVSFGTLVCTVATLWALAAVLVRTDCECGSVISANCMLEVQFYFCSLILIAAWKLSTLSSYCFGVHQGMRLRLTALALCMLTLITVMTLLTLLYSLWCI